MIKLIVTVVHLTQLVVHGWFMYETVVSFTDYNIVNTLWNQFKYLTNFSNWAMFTFLIPFVIYDFKNFNAKKIKERYPSLVNLLFQGLNPIIFLVMASYQSFLLIDPKLLIIDGFSPNEWQIVLLFYLHAGNWILMQFEYILYEHEIVSKTKLFKFFCSYTLTYLTIYAAYFLTTGKHVYGFQQTLTIPTIIILNIGQFSLLFIIDFLYGKVTHSKFFKKFIFEICFEKNQNLVDNKKQK